MAPHPTTARAHDVLEASRLSVDNFFDAFRTVRKGRNAKGTPTDEEQDLLRAQVLFAGAGLDSMMKQACKDALRTVVATDETAATQFRDWVRRRLRDDAGKGFELLSETLSSTAPPRRQLLSSLIRDLVGQSLQSEEQVLRTAAHFGISRDELLDRGESLGEVFRARNQISHEMDVDFESGGNRSRRSRTMRDMDRHAKLLLKVGERFLLAVEKRLRST